MTARPSDVELAIPKLRRGSFFPSILEPPRRIDVALYAVVMEAYVHGVSTRALDDLVEAMGSAGISKSEVSRICAGLDEMVGAFRERRLDHVRFPYIWLNGLLSPDTYPQAVSYVLDCDKGLPGAFRHHSNLRHRLRRARWVVRSLQPV
jgi:hypothetical protein